MKLDICSVSIVRLIRAGLKNSETRHVQLRTKLNDLSGIFCREERKNMKVSEGPGRDRRIQKTVKLLREALVSLMHEKSYDAIAVKEILDRANVGRSTFYTHFRDKDELLACGIQELLRSAPSISASPATGYEKVIRFSLPFFEYHDRHLHKGGPRMGTGGRAIAHEHLQKAIVELITDDVGKSLKERRKTAGTIPQALLAQYVASTFILVLNAWGDSSSSRPSGEANDLFRALVLPTLAAAFE